MLTRLTQQIQVTVVFSYEVKRSYAVNSEVPFSVENIKVIKLIFD